MNWKFTPEFFQTEFNALDHYHDEKLTYEEALPYLTSDINEYLIEQRILNLTMTFVQADINRDSVLSLPEWSATISILTSISSAMIASVLHRLVLRHFWAPIHLSSVGPLQSSNNGLVSSLSNGPLGGLYMDQNLVQVFMTNIVNVLLAQVPYLPSEN